MAEQETESTETSATESEESTTEQTTDTNDSQPTMVLVDESFEFNVADDVDVDKESLDGFKVFSIENKLPAQTAQSVLDFLINSRSQSAENQKSANAKTIEENIKSIKADPNIGGVNYDKVQSAVDNITLKYGGEDFKSKVIGAGLKNDPAFLRFINNLNSVLTEDSALTTSQTKDSTPVEETYEQMADNFFKN
jgi:hypothetical protein